MRRRLLVMLLCVCANACTARGVYEGIQNHNEALKTPPEKASTLPAPRYPDYESERKRTQGTQ